MKKIIIFTAILLVVLFLFFKKEKPQEQEKILVATSSFPLFDFASKIGGERVRVVNVLPSETEPFFFNPSWKDIAEIKKADIFFYNGAGIEPWVENRLLKEDLSVITVDVSSYFKLLDSPYYNENIDNFYDPHFVLDPLIAGEIGRIILKKLIETDPEGEIYYRENAKKTNALLDELHQRYKNTLKDCRIKTVVVSRPSLGYLAKRYNFEMIAVSGSFTIDRLSAQETKELLELIKQKNISYIFFETKKAETFLQSIANESETELLYFNPLLTAVKRGKGEEKDYFLVMIENLEQLKMALACR